MKTLNAMIAVLPMLALGFGNNVEVHFHVQDEDGHAITNATVKTFTQRDRLATYSNGRTPMREIAVQTDTDGKTIAKFPCYSGEFNSCARAPGYYDEELRNNQFKTRPGSLFYAKLLEYEKSLSFTLRRKKNPIPMFCNRTGYSLVIPQKEGTFGFDIMENDWVSPWGRGHVADFEVEYCFSVTNGNDRFAGRLMFNEDGSGAYKMKKMPFRYCSVYNADTNAIYCKRIDFVREITTKEFVQKIDVLQENEYLVIRTRVKKDAKGNIVSANYSKIYGEFTIGKFLHFEKSFFNPTPNDPNLEFDEEHNLAPRRRR